METINNQNRNCHYEANGGVVQARLLKTVESAPWQYDEEYLSAWYFALCYKNDYYRKEKQIYY